MNPEAPAPSDETALPLARARALVRDLAEPRPWIYWLDFLFHATLGWGAFALALRAPAFEPLQGPLQGIAYVVCALALYRAVIFTHELAHLRRNTFKGFRLVWNLLCGFPLLVPSFTYQGVHNDHHKRGVYGTAGDGEYLPFAAGPPARLVGYVALVLVLPILLAVRFILLTPLGWLHGGVRRWTWEHGSSLTIDPAYRRPAPGTRDSKTWRLQEFATFLYGATAITLTAIGVLPAAALGLWYAVGVLIFLLNSLRTLAAHRYANTGGRVLSVAEQYLDSVNIPGHPLLTPLWAPVGLRYHATHHLFPAIPYHALGAAHRRLLQGLGPDSAYADTLRAGLWDALHRLWREAKAGGGLGEAQTARR